MTLSQPLSAPLSNWPLFDNGCDKGPESVPLAQAPTRRSHKPLRRYIWREEKLKIEN
jgi:hypothetical protein